MKKRGCLIAIVVAGLIGAACYGLIRLQRSFVLSASAPYLFVSTSATNAYQAHFVTEGFVDRGTNLFVISDRGEQEGPVFLADLVYPNQLYSAVWSQDGSVIACRADVADNESVQKIPNEGGVIGAKRGFTLYPYVVAYDFRERNPLILKPCGSHHSLADLMANSNAIEKLLESRGGLGKEMSERDIVEQSKKMDWTQWQLYESTTRRPL